MPQALNLRAAEDWRSARIARRYMLATVLTPSSNGANVNIFGLLKGATSPEVFISRIRVHTFYSGAITSGAIGPLGWKRAITIGGTTMTLGDIPKCDTACATATLQPYTGTVTGTKANLYVLTHPAPTILAPATSTGGGYLDDWTARDLSERIRLTGTEGLILETITGFDVDTRVHCLVVWEEVTN